MVTCVYVSPQLHQFWIIDYRIFDPNGGSMSKLDPVHDILLDCVHR